MKKIALLALLAVAAAAHADGIALLTPVTYSAESSVVPKVREACKIEERLTADVGAALGSTTESTAGEVVRVSIVDVMGVGGGAWSGPKAISIRVDLMKNGKLERSTHLTRTTTGGAFGGFKGTCSMLERDSTVLGKDVAKWVASADYANGEAVPKSDGK
jgi:hypothetical protein